MNTLSNIGSQLVQAYGMASTALTAGAGGDNAEITGRSIDLTLLASRPKSGRFVLPLVAVLANTKSLVVTGKIEVSHNDSDWVVLVASATLETLTSDGGTTEYGEAHMDALDLQRNVPGTTNPIRYVRAKATPNLTATGTDTATVGAGVWVFGGLNETPQ